MYRNTHSLEARKKEAAGVLAKYIDKIPVICEVHSNSKHLIELKKIKYLVPNDITIGEFLLLIRKRIQLSASKSLFMFNDKNELLTMSQLLSVAYKESKNEDGFIYFTISVENTFG